MCIEAMDTSSKHKNTDYLHKTMKPGSKLRWKPSRVFMEDEALKRCGARATRSIRKHLRREQRRTQLAKLEKMEALYKEEIPAAACKHGLPSGAMAPGNTTQYLMAAHWKVPAQQGALPSPAMAPPRGTIQTHPQLSPGYGL